MPGPTIWRGSLLRRALNCGKVNYETLDERVRNVLGLVNQARVSGIPEDAEEGISNTPETSNTLRKLALASATLLKNENFTLPFKKDKTVL
jgi:beta-glucosidase